MADPSTAIAGRSAAAVSVVTDGCCSCVPCWWQMRAIYIVRTADAAQPQAQPPPLQLQLLLVMTHLLPSLLFPVAGCCNATAAAAGSSLLVAAACSFFCLLLVGLRVAVAARSSIVQYVMTSKLVLIPFFHPLPASFRPLAPPPKTNKFIMIRLGEERFGSLWFRLERFGSHGSHGSQSLPRSSAPPLRTQAFLNSK